MDGRILSVSDLMRRVPGCGTRRKAIKKMREIGVHQYVGGEPYTTEYLYRQWLKRDPIEQRKPKRIVVLTECVKPYTKKYKRVPPEKRMCSDIVKQYQKKKLTG